MREVAGARASVLTILRELPPPVSLEFDWRRAWRAVRILMADPDRTEQAFEIIVALSGGTGERMFKQLLAEPQGRMLFAERPALLDALSDLDWLGSMPAGSLGRAYAEFMRASRIQAQGLVEASDASMAHTEARADEHRQWFFDRERDMHDLQHVLTGYGTDDAGEAANLAFTFAQQPHLGMLLIVIAGLVVRPQGGRLAWTRYLLRAWRRGRRASWLLSVPFERLLRCPLDEVRWMLGIEPPDVAHPDGVIVTAAEARPVRAAA